MNYQQIHHRVADQARALLPELEQRIGWQREQIESHQRKALQQLLEHACQHSSWYRERCQSIAVNTMTLADITKIAPTTKADVMTHWDALCCRPDLSYEAAEKHLQQLRDGESDTVFYQDRYYLTATGGSSGMRGLFVWDLDFFAQTAANNLRYQYHDEKNKKITDNRIAVLTAPTLIHASTPLFTIAYDANAIVTHFPSNLHIDRMVAQLNHYQPRQLIGFSSIIHQLSEKALTGELQINPQRVMSNSEPLDDETRQLIRSVWQIEVNGSWGSVEMGMAGIEDDNYQGMLLSEDFLIIEPVDINLAPVSRTEDTRRLLVTNLYNYSLPLIRYVVDDVVEIESIASSAFRRVQAVKGRSDDWFIYPGEVQIHPMVFRHVLGQEKNVIEYQVEQTPTGALIRLVAKAGLDANALQQALAEQLQQQGLAHPQLELQTVTALPRHPETGKCKRFIPIAKG